jgi:hypothetical protein
VGEDAVRGAVKRTCRSIQVVCGRRWRSGWPRGMSFRRRRNSAADRLPHGRRRSFQQAPHTIQEGQRDRGTRLHYKTYAIGLSVGVGWWCGTPAAGSRLISLDKWLRLANVSVQYRRAMCFISPRTGIQKVHSCRTSVLVCPGCRSGVARPRWNWVPRSLCPSEINPWAGRSRHGLSTTRRVATACRRPLPARSFGVSLRRSFRHLRQ